MQAIARSRALHARAFTARPIVPRRAPRAVPQSFTRRDFSSMRFASTRFYSTESRRSAIDIIKNDHSEMQKYFDILNSQSDLRARQDALNNVVILLSEHVVAEETILYPVLRNTAKDPSRADKSLHEHQVVKELLERLRKMSPDDANFKALFKELETNVKKHNSEEEETTLKEIQAALQEDDLYKMGELFLMTKKAAPKQPHPGAPNQPPGNVVLGPVVAFIDKIKQLVKGKESVAQS